MKERPESWLTIIKSRIKQINCLFRNKTAISKLINEYIRQLNEPVIQV